MFYVIFFIFSNVDNGCLGKKLYTIINNNNNKNKNKKPILTKKKKTTNTTLFN